MNEKPWIGWAVAGVLLLVAIGLGVRAFYGSGDSYSPDRMREVVTIKFADTGDTMEIPRGRLVKMLADQGGKLDPNKGLLNPKTQQPTGFLFDKAEWEDIVKGINADKEEASQRKPGAPAPAPKKGS